MKPNKPDYTYIARPSHDIIAELFKEEFAKILKLSEKSFNPDTGDETNPREQAFKKLAEDRSTELNRAIENDKRRVKQNLVDIPMNTVVRISPTTTIRRVVKGWIYYDEIYNNHVNPSLINMISTFVPYT